VNADFLNSTNKHIDLGGYGRYPEALNITAADPGIVPYNHIDDYFQAASPKLPASSIDRITIESAPYTDDILAEVKRITKGGGSVELEHPIGVISDYNTIANKVNGNIISIETVVKDGLEYTRATIEKL